jgi:hypothetical protein
LPEGFAIGKAVFGRDQYQARFCPGVGGYSAVWFYVGIVLLWRMAKRSNRSNIALEFGNKDKKE